jgi:3-oxoacyl-[acyl-carrier protein] reductase
MSLEGKVAVVTGGASGIGEAIAMRFADDGAAVAVLDIEAAGAALTAGLAGRGLAVSADVADSGAVDRALGTVEAELGPVDIWVNNAGIGGSAEHRQRRSERLRAQLAEGRDGGTHSTPLEALERLTDEEWQTMLAVHLTGTFHGTRAAVRSMASRGHGCIVNVASVCGLEGCPGLPHYSAAKGGIIAFTRSVAKEVSVQGIRVNAVAPGYIETPLISRMSDDVRSALLSQTPQGRLGRPDEVAATVAFLVGEDASYLVGQTLSPNGGYLTV